MEVAQPPSVVFPKDGDAPSLTSSYEEHQSQTLPLLLSSTIKLEPELAQIHNAHVNEITAALGTGKFGSVEKLVVCCL